MEIFGNFGGKLYPKIVLSCGVEIFLPGPTQTSPSFPSTAAVSNTTGDDASGTGTDPTHVHPVHQPDNRCAGHTGQH